MSFRARLAAAIGSAGLAALASWVAGYARPGSRRVCDPRCSALFPRPE